MSSRQFAEWIAYYNIEPFGSEVVDTHLAKLYAVQVSTKEIPVYPKTHLMWRQIAAEKEDPDWDPQKYYDEMKSAFGFKKKE